MLGGIAHNGSRRHADDLLRGAAIERLMCDMEVDLTALAFAHGEQPGYFAAEIAALEPFVEDGLV